jgi:hypothetical protein
MLAASVATGGLFKGEPMHKCPHCGTNSVASYAVRWSSRSSPASCRHCGKLSHVLASTSSGIFCVCLVSLCVVLTAALLAESYGLAILGLCAVLAFNLSAWQRVELCPISPKSAKVAEQVSWWLTALAVLANFLS